MWSNVSSLDWVTFWKLASKHIGEVVTFGLHPRIRLFTSLPKVRTMEAANVLIHLVGLLFGGLYASLYVDYRNAFR